MFAVMIYVCSQLTRVISDELIGQFSPSYQGLLQRMTVSIIFRSMRRMTLLTWLH